MSLFAGSALQPAAESPIITVKSTAAAFLQAAANPKFLLLFISILPLSDSAEIARGSSKDSIPKEAGNNKVNKTYGTMVLRTRTHSARVYPAG